ncbi:hypothetical protein C8R47DRAFT_1226857 [Mycena vitilis]|nr:hypothetical protein C8R47DRAFT_1226857 [Mycena vitilis]
MDENVLHPHHHEEDEVEREGYDTLDARPWYKPSIPVLLALAPPIGNWLTGGDHLRLKDLLLLLLLVFYLISWLKAELRRLELALLLLCLLTPVLRVILLRSLASFGSSPLSPNPSSSASTSPNSSSKAGGGSGGSGGEPISWFSTSLFFLLTALRPLRDLTSRLSSRNSTLHTFVHILPFPSHSSSIHACSGLKAVEDKTARLEATVARLAQREDALYDYVKDALAPLEKGVRRVERRVDKLGSAKKNGELALLTGGTGAGASAGSSGTKSNGTIFIHAPAKQRLNPQSLIASWFGSVAPSASTSVSTYALPPSSPTVAGKRRALDPMELGCLEETTRLRQDDSETSNSLPNG